MTTDAIVLAIDAEIANLLNVKALLTGTDTLVKRKRGRPAGTFAQKKTASLRQEFTLSTYYVQTSILTPS
jgi:hypothetical protein